MHIYFSNSLELLSFTFRVSDLETLLLLEVWSLPVFLAGTAGTERLSGVHPCCEMALAYEPACLEPPSIWSNEYKDVFDFVFGWVDLVMWGNAEGEHQEIMRHGHIAPCLVIQWVWDWCMDGREEPSWELSHYKISLSYNNCTVVAHSKCDNTHTYKQKMKKTTQ